MVLFWPRCRCRAVVLSVGCVELSPRRIKPRAEFVSCSGSSLIRDHGTTHDCPVSFRGWRGQLIREEQSSVAYFFIYKMVFLLVSSSVLSPFFREGGSVLSDFQIQSRQHSIWCCQGQLSNVLLRLYDAIKKTMCCVSRILINTYKRCKYSILTAHNESHFKKWD